MALAVGKRFYIKLHYIEDQERWQADLSDDSTHHYPDVASSESFIDDVLAEVADQIEAILAHEEAERNRLSRRITRKSR